MTHIVPKRYSVEGTVGKGAQGVVYRVIDQLTGQRLALKVLHSRADGDKAPADLFSREFEVLAGLSHPRLIGVDDFGMTAALEPFYTRSYVEGVDLLTAAKGCTVDELIALMVETCRALKPLHRAGLCHGDLKPGNILISNPRSVAPDCTDTVGPEGWIIDYAFARDEASPDAVRGTVPYMAPELLSSGRVDVRTDLYALGVTFFEIWQGGLPSSGTMADHIQWHHHGKRQPPSVDRFLANTDSEAARLDRLGELVVKLMAVEPAARFVDLDELEAALLSLSSLPILPDPLSDLPGRNVVVNQQVVRAVAARPLGEVVGSGDESPLLVVTGDPGVGLSATARAVKWRLQVSGFKVVNLNDLLLTDPADWPTVLSYQLAMDHLDPVRQTDQVAAVGQSSVSPEHNGVQLGNRLTAVDAPLLLMAERVDELGSRARAVLRGILAAIYGHKVFLVVTAGSEFAWRDELGQGHHFGVPPYDRSQVAALARSMLGQVNEQEVDGLWAITSGNPVFLVNLLHRAKQSGAPLEQLMRSPQGSTLAAHWRLQLKLLPSFERRLLGLLAMLPRPVGIDRLTELMREEGNTVEGLAVLGRLRLIQFGQSGPQIGSPALASDVVSWMSDEERAATAETALLVVDDKAAGLPLLLFSRKPVNGLESVFQDKLTRLLDQHCIEEADALLEKARLARPTWLARPAIKLLIARLAGLRGATGEAFHQIENSDQWPHSLAVGAAVLRARLLGAEHKLEQADKILSSLLTGPLTDEEQVGVLLARCDVAFRAGAFHEVILAANRVMPLLDGADGRQVEVRCQKAKAMAGGGDLAGALGVVRDAVALADRQQNQAAAAFARDVWAWVAGLMGKGTEANEQLVLAADGYRTVGDLPRLIRALAVLGNNAYWAGQWQQMIDYHEESMRLGVASESPAIRNEARITMAFSLNCVGRFERAALLLQQAGDEARRQKNRVGELKTVIYRGDQLAWQGREDEALALWRQGYDGFMLFSNYGVCAELGLEMAAVYIRRKDLTMAKKLIDQVTALPRADLGRQFDQQMTLVKGALALATGQFEQGFVLLDELIDQLRHKRVLDLWWQAELLVAETLLERGADVLARKRIRAAMEILEEMAAQLDVQHRMAFWQDRRRSRVKDLLRLATSVDDSSVSLDHAPSAPDEEAAALYRILDFNKQIAAMEDLPSLMRAILDAAVELTGAERGFVLVPGPHGLDVAAARQMDGRTLPTPHTQFSRSIAESVFIDRTPIITVDAAGDDRFNEFLSIHHLQIKSVVCVPIAAQNEALGVLYLENRLRKGRFTAAHQRQITAFADQVAIALGRGALLSRLREANEELTGAKQALAEALENRERDLVERQSELAAVSAKLERALTRDKRDFFGLVGQGRQMQRVFEVATRMLNNRLPLVIVGAIGTGKDALAKVIHEQGPGRAEPFVTLSGGTIPETLLESTLFGHVKGAFSGAVSSQPGLLATVGGGTLYVDDVGELSPAMQVMMLRVLESGTFSPIGSLQKIQANFRLVVSSRTPLDVLVAQGTLRADLMYRLGAVTLYLPPLSRRTEDIPLLAKQIVEREASRLGMDCPRISKKLMDQLVAAPFPGNIRELEQVLQRGLISSNGSPTLTLTSVFDPAPNEGTRPGGTGRVGTDEIRAALDACQWNRSRAAKMLGMPRRTFYRRLKALGILE